MKSLFLPEALLYTLTPLPKAAGAPSCLLLCFCYGKRTHLLRCQLRKLEEQKMRQQPVGNDGKKSTRLLQSAVMNGNVAPSNGFGIQFGLMWLRRDQTLIFVSFCWYTPGVRTPSPVIYNAFARPLVIHIPPSASWIRPKMASHFCWTNSKTFPFHPTTQGKIIKDLFRRSYSIPESTFEIVEKLNQRRTLFLNPIQEEMKGIYRMKLDDCKIHDLFKAWLKLKIEELDQFQNKWDLIKEKLRQTEVTMLDQIDEWDKRFHWAWKRLRPAISDLDREKSCVSHESRNRHFAR